MPTRDEMLIQAGGEAARAEHLANDEDVEAVVLALAALRSTIEASLQPPELAGPVDPPRWMCVELFGHQVVYGLAAEVFWAGRRWLEVEWPTVYDQAGDRFVAEAGSKRYHPNAVYAMEEIGEDAVRKALATQNSVGGLGF